MGLICYKWNYFQVTVQIEQLNTYWQGCRWGMGKLEDWRWEKDLRRKSGWEKVVREGRLVWEEGAMHAGKDLIY